MKMVKTAALPGIQLRKLLLTDRNGKESLCNIAHMTEWPDFGVPASSEHVRNLLDILDHYAAGMKAHRVFFFFFRKLTPQSKKGGGPPVVHCSAGVGRTGTLFFLRFLFGSSYWLFSQELSLPFTPR